MRTALVLVVAIAGLAPGPMLATHAPPAAGAAVAAAGPPGDPAAGLDLATAYARASGLVAARRFTESLPYFARELALLRPEVWALHFDYATALEGASFEVATHRGVTGPRSRASFERVALMRAAIVQLDAAMALAPGPRERARVAEARAHHLRVWGFARDAQDDYERAIRLDPAWPEVAERARMNAAVLRDPLHAAAPIGSW